jgi:hypothetical protein
MAKKRNRVDRDWVDDFFLNMPCDRGNASFTSKNVISKLFLAFLSMGNSVDVFCLTHLVFHHKTPENC